MKKRSSVGIVILIISFCCALVVNAQAQNILSIKNTSGEKRKICFYNYNDRAGLVPKRCFTMNANEAVTYDRGSDTSNFMVKIFKPGLLDAYLYTRRLPGDADRIIMGEGGRFGFGRGQPKAAVTKYTLKVCNRQYDQPVYFALAFRTNDVFVTEGWWNVKKGQCTDFPVSTMLKDGWNIPFGSLPRTFFYARVYGDKPLYWRGGDQDLSVCIERGSAFKKVVRRGSAQGPCTGSGEEWVKFRTLDDPKTNQEYYYLSF